MCQASNGVPRSTASAIASAKAYEKSTGYGKENAFEAPKVKNAGWQEALAGMIRSRIMDAETRQI